LNSIVLPGALPHGYIKLGFQPGIHRSEGIALDRPRPEGANHFTPQASPWAYKRYLINRPEGADQFNPKQRSGQKDTKSICAL